MKNLKTNLIGLLACLTVIVVAFLLLGYGRKHEVASILLFGHALDAIVTAGMPFTGFGRQKVHLNPLPEIFKTSQRKGAPNLIRTRTASEATD